MADVRRALFSDPPVYCGHRGSGRSVAGGHRENTLASFRAAVAAGLRWVEVDARLSADGVLVVNHDPHVADGRAVAELSAAECDEVGLMRLGDLLADLPPEVAVNVEAKPSPDGSTAAAVAAIAARELARRRLLVSSFDPAAVRLVRERAPDVPIGLLARKSLPVRDAIAAAADLGAEVVVLHAESPGLSADAVRAAHEAGLEVMAWDARAEDCAPLTAAGVDCLIVDDPGLASRAAAPPNGPR
jgi:glycerophosphoryl diester phosphodiesterase